MVRTKSPWARAIPNRTITEATLLTGEVLGTATSRTLGDKQPETLAHLESVTAIGLHAVRELAGNGPAVRIARKLSAHDVGKEGIPGISNGGVWTRERRLWVRREHAVLTGAWAVEQSARLPDWGEIAFFGYKHHGEIPDDYAEQEPEFATQWGDIHAGQIVDRFEAISTREYVNDRHGKLNPDQIVAQTFAADPEAETAALPPIVVIDGQKLDFAPVLTDIAKSMAER